MNGLRIAMIVALLVLAAALVAQAAPLGTIIVAPTGTTDRTLVLDSGEWRALTGAEPR